MILRFLKWIYLSGLKDKLFQDDAVICVGGCFSQIKNDTYDLFTGNIYNLNIKEEENLQKTVSDLNVHHQARNMKIASVDNPIQNSLSTFKKKQVSYNYTVQSNVA